MKKLFIILVIVFFVATKIFAEDVSIDPQLKGVWRGTIGKQEVMVCFDDFDSNYYYLRYFMGIPLRQSDDGEWKEFALAKRQHLDFDHPTGYWKLDKITDRRLTLTGEWMDPGKKPTEPIELNLVKPALSKDQGCSSSNNDLSSLYNQPRVQAQKITRSEIKTFEGKQYRELSALKGQNSDIRTLELLDGEKGITAINKLLYKKLLTDLELYFDCSLAMTMFSYSPFGGAPFEVDYRTDIQPLFWNSHWISLKESSYNRCSERWNSGISFLTFDLQTSQQINLWNWIKDNDGKHPPETLDKIIISKNKDTDHEFCFNDNVYENNHYYDIAPTKEGLSFAFQTYTKGPCNGIDTTIPYPDLLPFLTDEGKAAVKSIMEESAKK